MRRIPQSGSEALIALSAVADAIESRLRNPTHIDKHAIGIDTRALAAFRVLMGLLIVGDVISRARNFSFYYTDDGVLSQSLTQRLTSDGAFSVFYYTSDPTVMAGIFVVTALVGIVLAFGYQTRAMTVIAFLLVISFDHQNPLVTSYADLLFRLLLFWAIFLPLGERWSVDAIHAASSSAEDTAEPNDGSAGSGDGSELGDGSESAADRAGAAPRGMVVGLASAAILAQMITMYVVNGVHKARSDMWGTTDVAPLVLGIDEMTFLLGDFMRQFPTLLGYGGVLWYYMMLTAWALVLLRGKARIAFVGLFVGGHLSFAVTVRIGAFAYVALAGLLLFLPPSFWDVVETRGRQGWRSLAARTPLSVSREDVGRRVTSLPSPRIESPFADRGVRVVLTATLMVAVLAVLVVPAVAVAPVADDIDGTHDSIDATVDALSIDQPAWSVFAPSPRTSDRYYVVAAMTEDGEEYDLFNDRELTYDRPYEELQKQHGTYRHRFYMNSVRSRGNDDPVSDAFADHLCETAAEQGLNVTHLQMFSVTEEITMETLDNHEDRERSYSRFYNGGCGDNDPGDVTQPPS